MCGNYRSKGVVLRWIFHLFYKFYSAVLRLAELGEAQCFICLFYFPIHEWLARSVTYDDKLCLICLLSYPFVHNVFCFASAFVHTWTQAFRFQRTMRLLWRRSFHVSIASSYTSTFITLTSSLDLALWVVYPYLAFHFVKKIIPLTEQNPLVLLLSEIAPFDSINPYNH